MSVRTFLEVHGLGAHVAAFEANHVTMEDLPAISDVELRDTFGMSAYGERRKFREAVAALGGGVAPARRGPGFWIWVGLAAVALGGWYVWTKHERAQALAAAEPGRVAQNWTSPTFGTMQWIPAGTFMMGSPAWNVFALGDESHHRVTLTKGFWLMEHEVTQGEWQAVMGENPSSVKACGPTCPVEQVSWDDAVAFIERASARDGVTYALPTEAQWEYAARAGSTFTYAGSDTAVDVAWTSENAEGSTHPVCQKERNGWGLCDMSGNVWEWTADGYAAYPSGAAVDPTGPNEGASRVLRGGSWADDPRLARVAFRTFVDPGFRYRYLGLRLSRTVP